MLRSRLPTASVAVKSRSNRPPSRPAYNPNYQLIQRHRALYSRYLPELRSQRPRWLTTAAGRRSPSLRTPSPQELQDKGLPTKLPKNVFLLSSDNLDPPPTTKPKRFDDSDSPTRASAAGSPPRGAESSGVFLFVELVLAQKDNGWKLLLCRICDKDGKILPEEEKRAARKVSGVFASGADMGDLLQVQLRNGHSPLMEEFQIVDSDKIGVARTANSMQRLLSSITGVGPAKARSLSDHLGPGGFESLDRLAAEFHHETTTPVRKSEILTQIRPPAKTGKASAISESLAEKVLGHWKTLDTRLHAETTYKDFHDFLARLQFPPRLIRSLHQWYSKAELEELLKRNKYELFHDGYLEFRVAELDEVHPPMASTDPRRIEAYVTQRLRFYARTNGFAAMPIVDLATELATIGPGLTAEAVEAFLRTVGHSNGFKRKKGVLVRHKDFIALPSLFGQEAHAASVLSNLASSETLMKLKISPNDLQGLNTQQQAAVRAAVEGNITLITGAAGTGKTQCVKALAHILEANRREKPFTVHVLAFTGRAAQRVTELTGAEAKTIHRTFFKPRGDSKKKRIPPKDDDPDKEIDVITIGDDDADSKKLVQDAVVIVDECSMIGVDVFDLLFGKNQRKYRIQKLILLGDTNQLQPIGPGRLFYDIVRQLPDRTVELSQVMRARGLILDNAQRVLSGSPLKPGPDFKLHLSSGMTEVVKSIATEWRAQWKEVIVLSATRGGGKGVGVHELNRMLQQHWNPSLSTKAEYFVSFKGEGGALRTKRPETWRLGDRVICVRNDYDKAIMNGQTGFITQFLTETDMAARSTSTALTKSKPAPNRPTAAPSQFFGKLKAKHSATAPSCVAVEIKFDFREEPVVVPAWEMEDLIEHAFAITVHKSQGNEFARVAVVLQGIDFENKNMLYTAITRAKTECVVLAPDLTTLRTVATRQLQLSKRHSVFDQLLAEMQANRPSATAAL